MTMRQDRARSVSGATSSHRRRNTARFSSPTSPAMTSTRTPSEASTRISGSIWSAARRSAATSVASAACMAMRWEWLATKLIRSSWLSTPAMPPSVPRTTTRWTRWRSIRIIAVNRSSSMAISTVGKLATSATRRLAGARSISTTSRRLVVVKTPSRSPSRTSASLASWAAICWQSDSTSVSPGTIRGWRRYASPTREAMSDSVSRRPWSLPAAVRPGWSDAPPAPAKVEAAGPEGPAAAVSGAEGARGVLNARRPSRRRSRSRTGPPAPGSRPCRSRRGGSCR